MRGPDKAFATLDVLTIDVDASRAIERVNLTRRSNQAGFACGNHSGALTATARRSPHIRGLQRRADTGFAYRKRRTLCDD